MGGLSWPSEAELDEIRKTVAEMSGRVAEEVRIVVSPYRICPLGAHIDHHGGTVSAMTINKGILLGFVPSNDAQVLIRSGQFKGEVRFRVDEDQLPRNIAKSNGNTQENHLSISQKECSWGNSNYARGALYALRSRGNHLRQGITGFLCGWDDRMVLTVQTKEHKLIQPPKLQTTQKTETKNTYKILLAFSGLKQALTDNPGYNLRVTECQEAANVLLSSGKQGIVPLLSNVDPEVYEAHKSKLETHLSKKSRILFHRKHAGYQRS